MGNWNITIRGVGIHHNRNRPDDADRMAAKFVQDLKAAGHSIASATITCGGEADVTAADYGKERDDIPPTAAADPTVPPTTT